MAGSVRLREEKSGRVEVLPVGWSWEFFIFSGLFGLPMLRRGLWVSGLVFAVMCGGILYLTLSLEVPESERVVADILEVVPVDASERDIQIALALLLHPSMAGAIALAAGFVVLFAMQLWIGFAGRGLVVRAYRRRGWRELD